MATIRRETFIPFGSPLPEKKGGETKFVPLFPDRKEATFVPLQSLFPEAKLIPFQSGMEGNFTPYEALEALEDPVFVLPRQKSN